MENNTVKTGEVIWYNDHKGYGFVDVGEEEIFLHRSALERFGLSTIYAGDHLQVTIAKNQRGIVKFFNPAKGYGFIDTGPGDADVFVHMRTLRNSGVHHLVEGQQLLLVVADDGRGPQATSIRLLAPE